MTSFQIHESDGMHINIIRTGPDRHAPGSVPLSRGRTRAEWTLALGAFLLVFGLLAGVRLLQGPQSPSSRTRDAFPPSATAFSEPHPGTSPHHIDPRSKLD